MEERASHFQDQLLPLIVGLLRTGKLPAMLRIYCDTLASDIKTSIKIMVENRPLESDTISGEGMVEADGAAVSCLACGHKDSLLLAEQCRISSDDNAAIMKAYQFASTNCHIMRQTGMNNENTSSNITGSNLRITRARAKALGSVEGLPPLHPSAKQDGNRVLRTNSKRAASYGNKNASSSASCPQQKKRAILKDITNITCDNLDTNCISATLEQTINQESKARDKILGRW